MFTIKEILRATDGQLLQSGDPALTTRQKILHGVSIDSRTIEPQELFVAIRGERFDGHDYLTQAVQKKAALLIVSQKKILFS